MRSGLVGRVWVILGLFGLSLIRLGSKYRRLWNVTYVRTSRIIVKCCSFRVLRKAFFILVWSTQLKRYSTFETVNLSSIGGRLHFNLFWFWYGPLSLSLKFQEDVTSSCWYIQLNILRSSSIGFRLIYYFLIYWYGSLSLSLKIEKDPISGCQDILLMFWCRLISWTFDFGKVPLAQF
jgi:hypothetical protein